MSDVKRSVHSTASPGGSGRGQPRRERFSEQYGIMMIDMFLAYLISLGIVGAGVGWIVVGSSTLCIGIGIASILVGVISVLNEANASHWR